MPQKLVTKGLVLRQTQTKEADKVLTVLTAERRSFVYEQHDNLRIVGSGFVAEH